MRDVGRRLGAEWRAYFPKALLVVDTSRVLDLFVASGAITTSKVAVVCIDGSPSPVVDWLAEGFRAGRSVPVAYLHDAASVVYPFTCEPLASLAVSARAPVLYRDLGLPPLGAPASTFGRNTDETILELAAVPADELVAYALRATSMLAPGDPNMAPLRSSRPGDGRKETRP